MKNLDDWKKLLKSGKLISLGVFNPGFAHDLKNPLAAIQCNADLIHMLAEKNSLDPEKMKDLSDRIMSQIKRLADMIEHVKQFCIEPNTDIEIDYDLNETVQMAIEMVGKSLKHQSIDLHTELSENLPKLKGNPIYLEAAVQNLITNAKNAHIANQETVTKTILAKTLLSEENKQVIEICDNAGGFKNTSIEDAFEPSFTTSSKTGFGLGLLHVKALLENIDATLEVVKSPEGNGIIAKITVP